MAFKMEGKPMPEMAGDHNLDNILKPSILCYGDRVCFQAKLYDIKEIKRIFNDQGIVKAYEKIMKFLEEFAENNPVSFLDMATRYIIVNQPD